MRPIDGDELMERLQSRFYAHNLKCDFDRCARSVILSCMEAVQRSPTICEPPNDPLALEELREPVKVVCCKDCKNLYFKDFSAFCPHRVGACRPDGFCEYGERRDMEDE